MEPKRLVIRIIIALVICALIIAFVGGFTPFGDLIFQGKTSRISGRTTQYHADLSTAAAVRGPEAGTEKIPG